jgi:hypothetical protein
MSPAYEAFDAIVEGRMAGWTEELAAFCWIRSEASLDALRSLRCRRPRRCPRTAAVLACSACLVPPGRR